MRVKNYIELAMSEENANEIVKNSQHLIGNSIPELETGEQVATMDNLSVEEKDGQWWVVGHMEITSDTFKDKVKGLAKGDVSVGSSFKGLFAFPTQT